MSTFADGFSRFLAGDFAGAVTALHAIEDSGPEIASDEIALHDVKTARAMLAALGAGSLSVQLGNDTVSAADFDAARARLAAAEDDWRSAQRYADRAEAEAAKAATLSSGAFSDVNYRLALDSQRAFYAAQLGDRAEAAAILGRMPADCDFCARIHGRIDALAKNWTGAAHWFAIVAARSPDIPFADTDWGQMLLATGDYASAIAKFESAHRKSPHFADPLELWGEALMQKNRSDLALAKFGEANKYAPNWGRLHLEWGKALTYARRRNEAQQQFAIAARLALSASDVAALALWRTKHV